jgi:hypothetical protein
MPLGRPPPQFVESGIKFATELEAHKELPPDAIRTVIGLWRSMRRVYDNRSRVQGDVAVADDGQIKSGSSILESQSDAYSYAEFYRAVTALWLAIEIMWPTRNLPLQDVRSGCLSLKIALALVGNGLKQTEFREVFERVSGVFESYLLMPAVREAEEFVRVRLLFAPANAGEN